MFKFVSLIKENWDRLATSITVEQGKTFADAKGDVLRGLQVAETACGVTTQLLGDVFPVAKNMETKSFREPLGVVAAICPFSESSHPNGNLLRMPAKMRVVTNRFRLPRHDPPVDHPSGDPAGHLRLAGPGDGPDEGAHGVRGGREVRQRGAEGTRQGSTTRPLWIW